ncbi:hypothetical protein N9B82_02520 [Saprospiraceae bacterium]|nr:hypothetical protein [Saprospiraceae bacterium]
MKINKVTLLYFAGILAWVGYLYLISYNGFIFAKSMPPRFPIFVFIPVIAFIGIFFYAKRNSEIFEDIPSIWAIYYQSFRVVMELIIFMTFSAGLIPIQATFQGYNFEIVFAFTAPIIAYFSYVKPIIPKKLVIAWNVIGILFLVIVVSIIVTSYFAPEMWGTDSQLIDIRFARLPLILLPAFIVPSAIFVHLFSILQLQKEIKRSANNA